MGEYNVDSDIVWVTETAAPFGKYFTTRCQCCICTGTTFPRAAKCSRWRCPCTSSMIDPFERVI